MATQRIYDGVRQRQPALASGHLGALDHEQLSPASSLRVALTGNMGEAAADVNSGLLEVKVRPPQSESLVDPQSYGQQQQPQRPEMVSPSYG